MKTVIYFLTTIIATSAGGVSGMGGGIIIKPVLDLMGDFTPQTIGVMSATTVFVMSLVSTWRNIQNGIEIKKDVAVTVALGSVAGGLAGQKDIFRYRVKCSGQRIRHKDAEYHTFYSGHVHTAVHEK